MWGDSRGSGVEGIGFGLDCRVPIPTLISEAKGAATQGFTSAWAIHYHYYKDPFAVLAAVGSATKHLALGTAVTNVYERHPISIAMSAATVAELTKGKMVLGLGRGVREILERQMGIPY